MDLLQSFLNIFIPVVGFCTLLILWPALTFRSIVMRMFNTVFEENMRGKIVLITGASSGIGEQTAYQYAKKGAVLVLISRREDKLRSVADKCIKQGAMDVRAIRADVSKEEDCRRFVEDTVHQYGRLDHLVNNAGVLQGFLFEEAKDVNVLATIWNISFWGLVYPTFYAIEHLKRSKGRIVVIASVASWLPQPRMSVYNAAKAAAFNFFDTIRIELGPRIGGITVVTPAFVESEMLMGKHINKKGEVEWREEQRDLQVGPAPVAYAEECAKAIVRGAVRGHRYVRYPYWSTVLLLFRVFTPEVIDFFLCLFYMTPMPGRKDKAPLSKVIMEIPGAKSLLYPSSIRNIHEKHQRKRQPSK
ncbi:hypothetical protein L7F22_004421 [Adiantum nelumboides]|nr:hypothetical protein [Adiantum nelumboides]